MATTPHKASWHNSLQTRTRWVYLVGLCWAAPCHAQVTSIQPSVAVTTTAQRQENLAGTPSSGGQSTELVTTISPALAIQSKGAQLTVNGLIALDVHHYARKTQSNQTTPRGGVDAVWFENDWGLGLEAGWTSRQVPAQFIGNTSATSNPANEYTTSEWKLAPFLNKALSPTTDLQAKLGKTLVHSSQPSTTLAERPDTTVTTGSLLLTERPTPLGYELSIKQEDTRLSGQNEPVLDQRTGWIKATYAPAAEVELGALIGRESTSVLLESYDDRIVGWSIQIRPQERSSLRAQIENRFFGKAWDIQASHRTTWMTASANFKRYPSTFAASGGTASEDGLRRRVGETNTDQASKDQILQAFLDKLGSNALANNAKELYTITAQLRQEASGRLTLLGRRNTISVAAGRTDSQPLTGAQLVLNAASTTRDYFFVTDWLHQMAPTLRFSGQLRWTRSHQTPTNQAYVFGREFSWQTALVKQLSPNASGTCGLRRKIVHSTNFGDGADSAAFAGLDYQF